MYHLMESLHFRWVGLVGQFRPKKVISSIKEDLVSDLDNLELLPALKDVATMFLDKTLYSYGLCSQFSPTPFSSVFASTEEHGDRKGRRHKAMFYHRVSVVVSYVSLNDN